jgi:hypothetical protein
LTEDDLPLAGFGVGVTTQVAPDVFPERQGATGNDGTVHLSWVGYPADSAATVSFLGGNDAYQLVSPSQVVVRLHPNDTVSVTFRFRRTAGTMARTP